MNKDHGKGADKELKGNIKEAAGKLTGSRRTENEGKTDKAKGRVQQTVGDVKDALKK